MSTETYKIHTHVKRNTLKKTYVNEKRFTKETYQSLQDIQMSKETYNEDKHMSKETYTKDLHIYIKRNPHQKPTQALALCVANTTIIPHIFTTHSRTRHYYNTFKNTTLLQHIQEHDTITTYSKTRYCVVLDVGCVLQLHVSLVGLFCRSPFKCVGHYNMFRVTFEMCRT